MKEFDIFGSHTSYIFSGGEVPQTPHDLRPSVRLWRCSM